MMEKRFSCQEIFEKFSSVENEDEIEARRAYNERDNVNVSAGFKDNSHCYSLKGARRKKSSSSEVHLDQWQVPTPVKLSEEKSRNYVITLDRKITKKVGVATFV